MKRIEEAAKSVEAAIEAGLAKLGVAREQVNIEVLSEGGVFSKAKVALTTLPTAGEKAVEFVETTIRNFGVGAMLELKEDDKEAVIDIIGTDIAPLIGADGEVIDAIQYVASLIANKDNSKYCRVIVDSEDYRQKRMAGLHETAICSAQEAVTTGRWIRLKPMNSHERRIVHSALAENTEVTTQSEGDEPHRCLVIIPNGVKYEPRTYGDKRGGDRPYDNRRGGDRPYDNRDNRDNRRGGGRGYGGSGARAGGRGGYGGGAGRQSGGFSDRGYGGGEPRGSSYGENHTPRGSYSENTAPRNSYGENSAPRNSYGGESRGGYGARAGGGERPYGAGGGGGRPYNNRGDRPYSNDRSGGGDRPYNNDRGGSGYGNGGPRPKKPSSFFSDAVFLGKSDAPPEGEE
ncbi:MAG: protein jag [Firmicutes bacterium]|nr:protein jag [Bacillota bacterium]